MSETKVLITDEQMQILFKFCGGKVFSSSTAYVIADNGSSGNASNFLPLFSRLVSNLGALEATAGTRSLFKDRVKEYRRAEKAAKKNHAMLGHYSDCGDWYEVSYYQAKAAFEEAVSLYQTQQKFYKLLKYSFIENGGTKELLAQLGHFLGETHEVS